MRPAFHCPNGGIGRRVGLKIQCPLKTCRFEPGFGHRDRSAGNFPPPTCLFLDSISILHFSLPSPSLHPCAFSISRFYSAPLTCSPSPSLHPRVFSIIPVPTISSLHSLHYFPIFPHYQKSPVPPFIPFLLTSAQTSPFLFPLSPFPLIPAQTPPFLFLKAVRDK